MEGWYGLISWWNWLIALPLVGSIWTGIFGGVAVDIVAFRGFKSWDDAASYDWGVASWRAFQGAVGGVLGHFGLLALQAVTS